jgi:hypothetical protein
MIQVEIPNRRPISELRYAPVNLGHRSFSAFPYRPLGLDLPSVRRVPEKKLGQSIPSVGIGPTLAMLAGGGAGFYIADIFPPPASSVVKVVGLAVVGYGLYSLFSLITKPAGVDAKAPTVVAASKVMSVAAFDLLTGQITFPASGTKPDVISNFWGSDNFPITVVWTNSPLGEGNFDYDILATSVSGPGAVISADRKTGVVTSVTKVVYTSSVRGLEAGHQSGPLPISIEVLQPPDKGTMSGYAGQPAPYFKMYLQLRKIGPGGAIPVGNLAQFGPFDWK